MSFHFSRNTHTLPLFFSRANDECPLCVVLTSADADTWVPLVWVGEPSVVLGFGYPGNGGEDCVCLLTRRHTGRVAWEHQRGYLRVMAGLKRIGVVYCDWWVEDFDGLCFIHP